MINIDEDIALIKKAQNGDRNALEVIVEKYTYLSTKVARSYFLIGAEYEDLLQIAYMGLWKACLDYDINSKASFITFATMCIKRKVIDAIKNANNKNNQVLNNAISLSNQGAIKVKSQENEHEEIDLVIPSNISSPDEKLMEREKLQEITEQIEEKLSKTEYQVLCLFLKGKSYSEIAKILNTENKAIDNALSRVRKKLKYLNR